MQDGGNKSIERLSFLSLFLNNFKLVKLFGCKFHNLAIDRYLEDLLTEVQSAAQSSKARNGKVTYLWKQCSLQHIFLNRYSRHKGAVEIRLCLKQRQHHNIFPFNGSIVNFYRKKKRKKSNCHHSPKFSTWKLKAKVLLLQITDQVFSNFNPSLKVTTPHRQSINLKRGLNKLLYLKILLSKVKFF